MTDGAPASVDVVFNAAGSSSLIQVNGSLVSSTANPGNGMVGGTLYLGQGSGAALLTGVGYEWAYTTGSGWTAATLGYTAANRSAYYSLGF